MDTKSIFRGMRSCPTIDPLFVGVFAKDQLPTKHTPGFYISNLDDSTLPGSHWVSLCVYNDKYSEYFCSYGLPPSERFKLLLGNNYTYNKTQVQNFLTTTCGQHAMFYIWCKGHGFTLETILDLYYIHDNNDIFVNNFVWRHFDIFAEVQNETYLISQISTLYDG